MEDEEEVRVGEVIQEEEVQVEEGEEELEAEVTINNLLLRPLKRKVKLNLLQSSLPRPTSLFRFNVSKFNIYFKGKTGKNFKSNLKERSIKI